MCYVNLGVFNNGKSKNDLYFHIRVTPTPTRAPSGGDWGAYRGCWVLYYQISCVMSILGFLIVGNPKMTFIFILKDLQPPQGRPQGGAYRGGWVLYYHISCSMLILGFSIVGYPKITFIFILRYPNPRKGTLRGGIGGHTGDVESYTSKYHVLCQF